MIFLILKNTSSKNMATGESCADCVQLKQIKALSRQVLKKYDELLEKYRENEKQYDDVAKKLKDREQMLEDMKKLIEPAMSEHERLMFKYNIEQGCRAEAENIARKMTAKNVSLKRQSQALLNHIGKLDITQIPEEILEEPAEMDTDSYKEYTDQLNKTIKDLEEKVSYYASILTETKQELLTERDNNLRLKQKNEHLKQGLKQTENTLTQYQNAMTELSTMSETAFEEYEHLREKYEIESKRRSETEKHIQKIKAQNEAMKTQSTILLSKVANDKQLTMALFKVEELEEEKINLEKQVDDLQNQIVSSSVNDQVELLEDDKSKLTTDVEELTKKVTNYEKLYANLESKYKEMEKKLEEALKPPPPPPPPLPPPPPTTKSKGFLSKIGKRKKIAKAQAAALNQPAYGKALEEMMKRIKSGKPLTTGSKQVKQKPAVNDTEQTGAMDELNSVLNRFKQSQKKIEVPISESPSTVGKSEYELTNALNRLKQSQKRTENPSSSFPSTASEPESELANVLNRFKQSERKIEVPVSSAPSTVSESESELAKAFLRVKRTDADE